MTEAVKDGMDPLIATVMGRSMQVALLLLPLIVILGRALGIDDMHEPVL